MCGHTKGLGLLVIYGYYKEAQTFAMSKHATSNSMVVPSWSLRESFDLKHKHKEMFN